VALLGTLEPISRAIIVVSSSREFSGARLRLT
jgi:hypothetical protein